MSLNPKFYLEKIKPTNFRNLDNSVIELHPLLTIFKGPNGHGKTNILESVYFLMQGKSFRKHAEISQILSMNSDVAKVGLEGKFVDHEKIHTTHLEFILGHEQGEKKRYSFDGKAEAHLRKFPIVLIQPHSSFMFFSTPEERRHWIDEALDHVDINFRKVFRKFEKLKFYKYQLIKKSMTNGSSWKNPEINSQLNFLNQELSVVTKYITDLRNYLVQKLTPSFARIFGELFADNLQIKLEWHSQFNQKTQSEILEIYQAKMELEWSKKKLLVGPHLDDLMIQSKQGSFTQNASMGQQKMAFLSLQFSLLDLFLGNPELHDPILLLDDISSEFDGIRWKNLIEYLRSYPIQMMITTARDSADFLPLKPSNFKIIYLNDGRVTNST